jgi:hypothetical protein
MTHADFVALVVKMRIAQRNYYSHRTIANLIAAKELERAVDAAVIALGEAALFGPEKPSTN